MKGYCAKDGPSGVPQITLREITPFSSDEPEIAIAIRVRQRQVELLPPKEVYTDRRKLNEWLQHMEGCVSIFLRSFVDEETRREFETILRSLEWER